MDTNYLENNYLTLVGKVTGEKTFSHEIYGEKFYRFTLSIPRLSGNADIIPITISERLITDEANSNNELINMNLQSFIIPRQEACKQFKKKYGLEGTDKEVSVRVRSDLINIIKKELSVTKDYENEEVKEVNENE